MAVINGQEEETYSPRVCVRTMSREARLTQRKGSRGGGGG